jgi:hypothetical protein
VLSATIDRGVVGHAALTTSFLIIALMLYAEIFIYK